jgi:hypothetical protein
MPARLLAERKLSSELVREVVRTEPVYFAIARASWGRSHRRYEGEGHFRPAFTAERPAACMPNEVKAIAVRLGLSLLVSTTQTLVRSD